MRRWSIVFTMLLFSLNCGVVNAQSGQAIKTEISLYFKLAEHRIDSTQFKRLDSIITGISALKIRSVSLSGYCDDRSSIRLNKKLAQKRIDAVVESLHTLGIDSSHVASQMAIGKQALAIGPGTDSVQLQRKMNRRVDVVVWALRPEKVSLHRPILFSADLLKTPRKELAPEKPVVETPKPSRIGNILFVPGTTDILPECQFALNALFEVMDGHPNCKARIEGHIWNPGGFSHSYTPGTTAIGLSFARAKKVSSYLIQRGISANRITHIGLEDFVPTNKGGKFDRRVEVKLKYDDDL